MAASFFNLKGLLARGTKQYNIFIVLITEVSMGKAQQYIDLARKIESMISDGSLPPGSRLPTHRDVAEKHGVALATATRAYKLLISKGLIIGERGRGMFVRHQGHPLPRGFEQVSPDGFIDLTLNMPGNTSDSDLLRSVLRKISAKGDLESMLRYQPHVGRAEERLVIANYARRLAGDFDPERLLITSGGQHGLFVSLLSVFNRGDTIAVDPLTYPGFITASSLLSNPLFSFSKEGSAIDLDHFEDAIVRKRIKGMYLIPTVHNPLGYVMSKEERDAVVYLSRKYGLTIIEDMAYAFLEPDAPPSFSEIAPEVTVQVGSFSKNIATGLRVGYLISPEKHVSKLASSIKASTWNTPSLMAAIVTNWIEDGTINSIEKARKDDGASKQLACKEVLGEFDIQAHSNANYLWLRLHNKVRAEKIMSKLLERDVVVSTAEPFCTTDAVPQALRIAFGGIPDGVFDEAINAIRDTLKRYS
ncbi:PLP-dependent aminotransferase family protein [Chromohalobacter israelensis]|uniref:aminotransferase-like domain-containing protein n=1 Tax=Chromohalobacter israelensis TaxID=141390 RepID=UPI003AF9B043